MKNCRVGQVVQITPRPESVELMQALKGRFVTGIAYWALGHGKFIVILERSAVLTPLSHPLQGNEWGSKYRGCDSIQVDELDLSAVRLKADDNRTLRSHPFRRRQ